MQTDTDWRRLMHADAGEAAAGDLRQIQQKRAEEYTKDHPAAAFGLRPFLV